MMSVVSPPISPSLRHPPSVPSDSIYPLTVRQYHEMIRGDILTEDDPVELLEGMLVVKAPKNPLHAVITKLGEKAIERAAPRGWHVRVQEPITLSDSEPEPDLVLVRGEPQRYLERHPSPADTALVIEVADTTLARDRGLKQRVYAAAKIPVYWIMNLVERQIEVYSEPSGAASDPGYHHRRDFGITDEVPLQIRGREYARLRVGDLIPAPTRRRRK